MKDKIKIIFKLYEFDKVDKDGDMILSKGATIPEQVPVLWNWDSNRPPFCILRKQEAEKLFNAQFGKYLLAPGGRIEKSRKPTKEEKIKNPKLKRVIEKVKIMSYSLMPYDEIEEKIVLPEPNNGETVTKG